MTDLAKTFEPGAIEAHWYAHWEGEGLFRPSRPDATPFTIVMPPPNVTGSLHIGHALDNTLQDILIRHARLQGKDALWVVGTDHAGIATQMVVERQLNERQDKRTNYSRDDFIAKVWEWKSESGGQITQQLRRLGASCDWANERFTMDPGFSAAVTRVFVDLYNKKLLYRDKRLVNWDPGLKTAISDLEVETREVQGKFWHLRYPLADGSGHINVATTRPETMLADMAVAVNASDERYTALIGSQVRLPITGRLIPIVADDHADPELGSGAVKVTPGHDFNDFEVGKRAGIAAADMLNMFDADARVVQTADGLIPAELIGLNVRDARDAVVALLEAEGALISVEERVIQTPFGDRSGAVIEPWLTDQWYVDAKTLVGPVLAATRSGAIRIVPESWSKTWFNWLENIQPWCVSRQLWWGHRIPAWYGPELRDGKLIMEISRQEVGRDTLAGKKAFVAETEEEALALAREYYGSDQKVVLGDIAGIKPLQTADGLPNFFAVSIARDHDVLDTWFSSALWPFATLGWPQDVEETLSPAGRGQGEGTPTSADILDGRAPSSQPSPPRGEGALTPRPDSDLARHYPNDVLISGFDILFFWDARMAMQGIEFMGEAPWKTLYLHGLVRDANGQKMSKSKGNTVDPLGLIDRYGADALRFTMAAMESQGRDIKLDEKRVEGYRNFATKLWNAARFLQGNGVGASQSIKAPEAALPVNRWIIGEVVETLAKLDKALADLRFDDMADAIYHFTWGTFCDWYVELVKGEFDAPEVGEETSKVAAWAFDQILVMLHPFMPFITEELWHSMGERPYELIVAKWPAPEASADVEARRSVQQLIGTIDAVRSVRAEMSIPWTVTLYPRLVRQASDLPRLAQLVGMMELFRPQLLLIAKLDGPIEVEVPPSGSAQIIVDGVTIAFPLEGVIDIEAEKARLAKAIAAAEKDRDGLAARLANPAFSEKAKPEAVEKARADYDARAAEAERLGAALARLG